MREPGYWKMGHNASIANSGYDELLKKCWAMTDCWTCLKSPHPCGWCPVSGTCVPNESPPMLLPILTPIFNEDICPHWSERWELRAKPMMCNVSTITFLSSLISILATISVIFVLFLIIMFFRCICGRRRRERYPHMLVIDTRDSESAVADERTSLLGRFRRRNDSTSEGPASPTLGPRRRQSFWVYNTMPTSAPPRCPPTPRQVTSADGDDEASIHDGQEGAGRPSTRSEWEERRRQLLGKRTNYEQ